MKQIIFKGRGEYAVLLGKGILSSCGELIRTRFSGRKILIVSDAAVASVYLDGVAKNLEACGIEVFSHILPEGAVSKSLSTAEGILTAACDVGLSRKDAFLSLGGGVCHDITGFSASVYRRGAGFISLPTSLVAMSDASVGGKVWCDLPGYTDMVGAYKEPLIVISDVTALDTLPQSKYTDGMAEIIKTAALGSAELFTELCENAATPDIEDVILRCLNCKKAMTEAADGVSIRRMLDFGNTVGGAIERYYGPEAVSHGQALGIGMVAVTDAAERAGITVKGTAEKLAACLAEYSLPARTTIPLDEISRLMTDNVKRTGEYVVLPTLADIAKPVFLKLAPDEVLPFFEKGIMPKEISL